MLKALIILLVYITTTYGQNADVVVPSVDKLYTNPKQHKNFFAGKATLMAEFQPTLQGSVAIARYYDSLHNRNLFAQVKTKSIERFDLGHTIVEIGEMSCIRNGHAEVGKYWNVWKQTKQHEWQLFTHAFGFNQHVVAPEQFFFSMETSTDNRRPSCSFEFKAYNALMEKAVRERNGNLRTEFFADDAIFYPYNEPPKAGKSVLLAYMLAYNSGDVTIDHINIVTTYCETFGNTIVEYNEFGVQWKYNAQTGSTKGKGIRIWQRQRDGSLRIYREIGLHNL